ncbi:glycosyltransferase family 4 protein [Vibrio mimicus]
MRIAIFPDEYLPESTRVHAKMLHELALELKRLGNEVVIIAPGHSKQQTRLSVCYFNGIEVWRFKSGILRGKGRFHRALNETLLSFRAWIAIRNKAMESPFDICINYSPTIFFGPLMAWFKKNRTSYVYLILRDIFPKWVIDEGVIRKDSFIARYFVYFEHLNYRNSDKIGLMSKSTLEHFKDLYPEYCNLNILPNWANCDTLKYKAQDIDIRVKFELKDKIIFFYGGNIGQAQNVFNLLKLANEMKDVNQAHFLFVGQGDSFQQMIEYCELNKLTNVTYMPSVEQDIYEQILGQVDVGMVCLAESHSVNHHPGKVLGYMKYSLPILACLNRGNDLIELINNSKSGFGHCCVDIIDIKKSANELIDNEYLRQCMGNNSRKLLEQFFSTENAARIILNSYSSRSSEK